MEMPAQSIPVMPVKKDSSLGFRGLYEVFVSPSTFFARLKDDPKIWLPYVAGFLTMLLFLFLTWEIVGQIQMDVGKRLAELNPQIPPPTPPSQLKSILGGSAGWLLVAPVAALLAFFWGNFVMAGKARYAQVLSVMLYGEIIAVVGKLLLSPLMIAKDSPYVSFSLAAFLTPDPFSSLWTTLSEIDVFQIWEVIAIGIGLSILYGFSRNKGYLLSVLSMGLLIVLKIGMMLLVQSFVS